MIGKQERQRLPSWIDFALTKTTEKKASVVPLCLLVREAISGCSSSSWRVVLLHSLGLWVCVMMTTTTMAATTMMMKTMMEEHAETLWTCDMVSNFTKHIASTQLACWHARNLSTRPLLCHRGPKEPVIPIIQEELHLLRLWWRAYVHVSSDREVSEVDSRHLAVAKDNKTKTQILKQNGASRSASGGALVCVFERWVSALCWISQSKVALRRWRNGRRTSAHIHTSFRPVTVGMLHWAFHIKKLFWSSCTMSRLVRQGSEEESLTTGRQVGRSLCPPKLAFFWKGLVRLSWCTKTLEYCPSFVAERIWHHPSTTLRSEGLMNLCTCLCSVHADNALESQLSNLWQPRLATMLHWIKYLLRRGCWQFGPFFVLSGSCRVSNLGQGRIAATQRDKRGVPLRPCLHRP